MTINARNGSAGMPNAANTEERLLYARTGDGLDLAGMLITPKTSPGSEASLFLWVHTRQLNFSEPEYVGIGRQVAAAGFPFLTVNTRGHDFGSWFRGDRSPRLGGSAWEVFTDCVADVDAWVERALALGYRRIILTGHGFGGAKTLHFQAQRQRREITALILASSGSVVRDKITDDELDAARRMVAEGRGRDLMPWGTGGDAMTSTVSADWYVGRAHMHRELYGDGALPPAISRIRCPIFAWFGKLEPTRGRDIEVFLESMRYNATATAHFEASILNGVDFFYTGSEHIIARKLIGVAERLSRASSAA